MASFFELWQSFKQPGLNETFLAFQQTCRAISSLTHYFIDECGFNYILLSLIQSDNIVSRFGWYRQVNEKKIRTFSLLKYSTISIRAIDAGIMKKDNSAEILRLADNIRGDMLFNYVAAQDEKII